MEKARRTRTSRRARRRTPPPRPNRAARLPCRRLRSKMYQHVSCELVKGREHDEGRRRGRTERERERDEQSSRAHDLAVPLAPLGAQGRRNSAEERIVEGERKGLVRGEGEGEEVGGLAAEGRMPVSCERSDCSSRSSKRSRRGRRTR